MKILVFVKRVPATTARIRVADGLRMDPEGVEFVLNPYDEFAVEEALRRKEAAGGDTTVTAITLGPPEAQKELRTVLAMGADEAILLTHSDAAFLDAEATAQVLAEQAEQRGPWDLVFFGKQAVDRDQHGVGPSVATRLGMPCLSEIVELEIADGKATARREVEGASETLEAPLPCAFTCQKGLNEPRYASLKGIMAAKRKPLETVQVDLPPAKVEVVELAPPPPRPPGRIVGEGAAAVPELVRALREEAKVL